MATISIKVPGHMSPQTFLRVLSELTAGGFNEIVGEPSDEEKAVDLAVGEALETDAAAQRLGVYLTQRGEGCDYTIGCARTLVEIDATTREEAEQECRRLVTREYTGESEVETATLVQIVDQFPVQDWYEQEEQAEADREAAAQEAAERAKLAELQAKYPNG